MNSIMATNSTGISAEVDAFTYALNQYLVQLGLPTDNVLVPVNERTKLINNFPDVLSLLANDRKGEYLYLSKFIAACGVGLFDAALNFLWDETVINLRNKVINFDIEYFFDSTITDQSRRSKLNSADDLDKIEEWELIRGCHLTGILSDIGFKHLDYIRDMRNWASAAHPNQNQITGLQLVGWLETCIKEVIGKEPEAPAIEVKKLLSNVRNTTLTSDLILYINHAIERLPNDILASLLKTLFGMYTTEKSSVQIKDNIKSFVRKCWELSNQNTKYECGLKYAIFASNGDAVRKSLAHEFLEFVAGLQYLPTDTLSLEIAEKVNNLYVAHNGLNNFHNEPAHAKALKKYIPENGNIPAPVRFQYVKTIIMAKIGNGYGVSWNACEVYNELISKFTENEIIEFTKLFSDGDLSSRISLHSCCEKFKEISEQLITKTVNQISIQILNEIIKQTPEQLTNLGKDSTYKQLISAYSS